MCFVSLFLGQQQHKIWPLAQFFKDHFVLPQPRKPPDKMHTTNLNKNQINKNTLKESLQRLALISSINILASLPSVNAKTDMAALRRVKKYCNFMGLVLPSLITDPLVLDSLRDYAASALVSQYDLVDGAFHFIVDTGCSTSASPHKEDFESLFDLAKPITLHGIAGNSQVTQAGMMRFQCINTRGEVTLVRTPGFYDTNLHVRLFSPQAYFLSRPRRNGKFTISWSKAFLDLNNGASVNGKPANDILPCIVDHSSRMPLLTCFHDVDKVAQTMQINNGIVDVDSDNLTSTQRQLLRFHFKLGHLGFKYLKWVLSSGLFGPLGMKCADKDIPNPPCQACLQGGQQRNPTAGNVHTQVNKGATKRDQLIPGQRVFSDQYVSSAPGRNYNGRGQTQSSLTYKGGTVFADAASSYISIHHQMGFTATETISSKIAFEREASSVGVSVSQYNTDNGVYTSKDFTLELAKHNQTSRLSGVGAHHHNGPAESAIKNLTRRARIFMFHAALRWPDHYDKSLWPLAMSHAVHLHNHTPRRQDGLCPVEIWSSSKSNYAHLQSAHPWGCPVYVLDPRLQDGFKIPRWEPRSRRGVYMGVSPLHASTVALVLNPNTNRLSPQFHCVFDDYFETVHHKGDKPPPMWEDLVINSRFRNDIEDDVDDTWDKPVTPVVSTPRSEQHRPPPSAERPATASPPVTVPPMPQTSPSETAPVTAPPTPVEVPEPQSEPVGPRRSTRVRKPVDRFTPDKAHGYASIQRFAKRLITCLCLFSTHRQVYDVNYATALALDPNYGVLDGFSSLPPDFLTSNPWMFKAKKTHDPDTPTIREALTGPYRDDFLDAMSVEIDELEAHTTWSVQKIADIAPVTRPDGTTYTPQIVPLTWAYKIKRWPNGLLRKVKARICVRGDLQTEGVDDVWATYAPVASWSSIRMLTVLALQNNWVTKQIDFSNAFVQAPLDRDVYVALPPMFDDKCGLDPKSLCLKLNRSLYGMRDAPKLWNDFLEKGLRRAQFTPSHEDPGVYYGRGMAIVVYVDDVLFFGPDGDAMEVVINELQSDGFELKREKSGDDTAYNFLGIHISETDGVIKLTQHGLIKKFLATVGMTDCNAKQTPCSTTPLGADIDGPPHDEPWEYASAVGMLMYLAGNAHPETAFAVHQCARYAHSPRHSHTIAIKHLAKYFKGILDHEQGLIYKPTQDLALNCYVDADFAGLWGYEDDQDPVCVRSRSGYVFTMGDCPVHWTSKLQTEIALSTTEAEYISLAQALREFIPLRRAFDDMLVAFGLDTDHPPTVKSTIFEDNNGAISTARTPKMTPRTKHIAVKYHFVKTLFSRPDPETVFSLVKIDTLIQKADIFTKGLTADGFLRLRRLLCNY